MEERRNSPRLRMSTAENQKAPSGSLCRRDLEGMPAKSFCRMLVLSRRKEIGPQLLQTLGVFAEEVEFHRHSPSGRRRYAWQRLQLRRPFPEGKACDLFLSISIDTDKCTLVVIDEF